jgi:hypothetical protein
MSETKNVFALPLSTGGRMAIAEIRQKTGMSEAEAVQKLLTWFASQDEVLRTAILESDCAKRGESPPAIQEVDLV